MGAKELIFSYYLLLFASDALSVPQRIPIHYEFAEKYSCVKKLDVFFDRAILFKYARNFLNSWPGNVNFDCTTSVNSRTYKMGIIGVIQKMKFRKNSQCLDHISFVEGNAQRCGEIVFGLSKMKGGKMPPPPLFISGYPGPFLRTEPTYRLDYNNYDGRQRAMSERTELVSKGAVVNPTTVLETFTRIHSTKLGPGDEMEMEIAFTGYKDCDDSSVPRGWFNCGYGVCILMHYVGDGVVNCPFGDCRDEGSCEEAMALSPLINGGYKMTGGDNTTETVDLADIIYKAGSIRRGNSSRPVYTNSIYLREEEYSKYSQETLEEVKTIGDEFKKHNGILERISELIESAVSVFRDKKSNK